jgi:hypothetical protein
VPAVPAFTTKVGMQDIKARPIKVIPSIMQVSPSCSTSLSASRPPASHSSSASATVPAQSIALAGKMLHKLNHDELPKNTDRGTAKKHIEDLNCFAICCLRNLAQHTPSVARSLVRAGAVESTLNIMKTVHPADASAGTVLFAGFRYVSPI